MRVAAAARRRCQRCVHSLSLLKADTLANKLFNDEYLSLTDLKRPVVCVVCLASKLERKKELDAMNVWNSLAA